MILKIEDIKMVQKRNHKCREKIKRINCFRN